MGWETLRSEWCKGDIISGSSNFFFIYFLKEKYLFRLFYLYNLFNLLKILYVKSHIVK